MKNDIKKRIKSFILNHPLATEVGTETLKWCERNYTMFAFDAYMKMDITKLEQGKINSAVKNQQIEDEAIDAIIRKKKITVENRRATVFAKFLNDVSFFTRNEALRLRTSDSKLKGKEVLDDLKLSWKGTPAQLAFIINLLQEKGYLGGLTPYGERNAKIVLMHFEIKGHNSTPESLGRCFQQLKNDVLPINKEDAAKFQRIPRRNDLKK